MPAWPATLPKPLAAGYSLTPQDNVIRTDMDKGAPRSRRTSFAEQDLVNMAVLLTDAQYTIFRDWFKDVDEANGGASWFDIALGVGEGGLTTKEAKFTRPFTSNHAGNLRWNITMELMVRYA